MRFLHDSSGFCLPLTTTGSLLLALGCGNSTAPAPSGPVLSGSTSVVLLATSAANDQLSAFSLGLSSLTLTSQAGKSVPVLTTTASAEFIHLNGGVEPLATVSVPQDVYTGATATVGGAQFTCISLDSAGGVQTSESSYGMTPANQVSVTFSGPITVSGTAMGLALNLAVAKSATFARCDSGDGGANPYSINPTFTVTPVTFAAAPTDSSNGRVTGLSGMITAVQQGGSGFTVTEPDAFLGNPGVTLTVDANTQIQGVSGLPALAVGMPVTLDANFQTNGSLLATRVAVADADPTQVSVVQGYLASVYSSPPTLNFYGVESQGFLFTGSHLIGASAFSYGSAVFQISGELGNLQNLPFAASFSAQTMVPGQQVSLTTHAADFGSNPTYVPATTMTLVPQTIDGTVSAMASAGGFEVYTVSLAPYALTNALAVQAAQTTLLTSPATVVVYVDTNAERLDSGSAGVGSVLRFRGGLFNDHGTLRMDCVQVSDGVAE